MARKKTSKVGGRKRDARPHRSVQSGYAHGLAFDAKNHVLFVSCGQSGNPAVTPARPVMVILNADNGAVFNPATMEVFSSHGNGAMTIVKENERAGARAHAARFAFHSGGGQVK